MNVEIDWKILVGQIINFAILFFVLKQFIYKPFLSLLRARREKIEEGVNKGTEAEEGLKNLQEIKRKMEDVNEEERKVIISKAAHEAKKMVEEAAKSAEEEKFALLARAEKEARTLKEKDQEKTKREIIDNTFTLTEKLLRENIDDEKNKKITEEFLKKLKI